MTIRSAIAPVRFGLGLRLGEAAPRDPEAWLLQQLQEPAASPAGATSAAALQAQADAARLRSAALAAGALPGDRRRQEELIRGMLPSNLTPAEADAAANPVTTLLRAEARLWAEWRLTSAASFRDRLVDFWCNHFTVSRRNTALGGLAGTLEREAIRPHVTGRFADMLVAVTRHPAMLLYLDNQNSVGPHSPLGQRSGRSMNENLAREVLELHTLSREGGYGQPDVEGLAKILTGWSVSTSAAPLGFVWRPQAHEPGPKTLLGRRFPEGPESQEAALRMLAAHPSTYRHLAVKLARHFVADDPPAAVVQALEDSFRRSEGDLGAVHRRLVTLPEAWAPPLGKFRAPQDYVLAACRAAGVEQAQPLLTGLSALEQPLYNARQPDGWPDRMAGWAGPEALLRRADWAYNFSGRLGRREPGAVAAAALGPLARAETAAAMRGAGSVRDALAILFCCPEFMYR